MQQSYGDTRVINWQHAFCGEKAAEKFQGDWFPEQTLNVIEKEGRALVGPITAPIGYGFKSLNVALRHELGLKHSYTRFQTAKANDIYILRDNSEDLPIKLEWQSDSADGSLLSQFLNDELGVNKVAFDSDNAIALKYVSKQSAVALIKAALKLSNERKIAKIVYVHHAHVLPLTEGSMARWIIDYLRNEYQFQSTQLPPFKLPNTQFETCSLLQFFSSKHQFEQDVIVLTGNYIAAIISDFYTGSLSLINKVSQTNFNSDSAIFDPKHGPLHSLAKTDAITPEAMLSAVVSLLYFLQCEKAAVALNHAILRVKKRLNDESISFKRFQKELANELSG